MLYRVISAVLGDAPSRRVRRWIAAGGLLLSASASWAAQPFTLSAAIETALEKNPNIRLERETAAEYEGILQAESGRFDANLELSASAQRTVTPLAQPQRSGTYQADENELLTYRVGVSQPLRWGTTLMPAIGYTYERPEPTGEVSHEASVSFVITQPLLRGRGSDSAASEEIAAESEASAARLYVEHQINLEILRVVEAYWRYRDAFDQLRVWDSSVEKAEKLIAETQVLVKGGERPISDVGRLQANLADKKAVRLSAQQELFNARQELGWICGLDAEEILALGPPADRFPSIDRAAETMFDRTDALIELALRNRSDYLATLAQREAEEVRVGAALRDLEPELDLTLDLGYSGVSEGVSASAHWSPYSEKVHGPNLYAGLSFRWPIANNVAEGALAQRRAVKRGSEIAVKEAQRSIRTGVIGAANDLRLAAQRLAQRQESIIKYEQSLEDEEEKLQTGLSTLIDVILTEELLTSSRLNLSRAQSDYANALVALRFETGSLAQPDPGGALRPMEVPRTQPAEERP